MGWVTEVEEKNMIIIYKYINNNDIIIYKKTNEKTLNYFFSAGDRRCGHPAVPPNAIVSLSNDDLAPGTLATYECDEGYELFGGHQKECTLRGDWKGDSPFCGT